MGKTIAEKIFDAHLVDTPFHSHLGYYAVRTFFVLSSFAMTAALHEQYAFDGARCLRGERYFE